ncbi:NitT/TauT family transport system permease protein [Palleronia marisminoris]|uniref:Putative aliphatic sulfonates transport permease protein SsuC n=1 Tax=Palleronia marisminoris TaxID=315423 RepID=A0A1Y5SBJ9_9RHOB|nr:ABC transporter permease [Palleronia marisminoris]SFG72361.1 NitT/TauT family transport system permease protein [Palleronia marisminoris]SLN37026.1 Putative aliphatic sulfonates transport permease protein SsuC [Palleronia marisminoris]
MSRSRSATAARLLSVALFFLLWHVVSLYVSPRLFPSPWQVATFVLRETESGVLPYHLSITLLRVLAAFVLAMAVGSALGFLMGRSRGADVVLQPWLILTLNIPALVVIILSYIWIGMTETAAITAVALNKIPNVAVTIREGARAMDPTYMEMARVYRFSRVKIYRDVIAPQLQPYFAAAARSGIALVWKIVLVVELLGRSNGVGFQIHLYFQLFDVRAIMGYTLAFVAVMLAVEFLALQPLDRRAQRWRPKQV